MTSEIVILITELRNKQRITLPAGSYRFGRSAQCEYVLRRNNVGDHQFTVSFANGQWGVTDGGSDYRTWYNNRYLEPGETSILQSGDVVGLNTDGDADTQEITFRVEEITSVQGDGMAPKKEQTTDAVLRETDIRRKRRVLIGRGDDCDIKLVNDRVSRHHCEILYKDGHYELHDLGSTNGTYVDGVRVTRTVLRNGAVINVPAQVFAFTGGMLHYHAHQSGISIQLVNVYKTVKNANTGKPLNIVDGTSLQVESNSFVVLVGGSGTGKSSLLTCITGTAPCTAGSVKFDGLDTRSNRNAFEAALGYVPQKDIMHDNLTVEQSLTYTAKLRIAHDATRAEIAAAVAHAIEAVDLQGARDHPARGIRRRQPARSRAEQGGGAAAGRGFAGGYPGLRLCFHRACAAEPPAAGNGYGNLYHGFADDVLVQLHRPADLGAVHQRRERDTGRAGAYDRAGRFQQHHVHRDGRGGDDLQHHRLPLGYGRAGRIHRPEQPYGMAAGRSGRPDVRRHGGKPDPLLADAGADLGGLPRRGLAGAADRI